MPAGAGKIHPGEEKAAGWKERWIERWRFDLSLSPPINMYAMALGRGETGDYPFLDLVFLNLQDEKTGVDDL